MKRRYTTDVQASRERYKGWTIATDAWGATDRERAKNVEAFLLAAYEELKRTTKRVPFLDD